MTKAPMMTKSTPEPFGGPALFSYGFRPLFLGAGIFAVLIVPLWMAIWSGQIALAGPLTPLDWHIHEMLFGYTSAVIAGFLFTASPNWTGRMASAPGRAFSTAELADEFGLSRHHLTKIMQRLGQGGIVTTRRGSGGGATLARDLRATSVGAIVRLLEEGQPLVECFAATGAIALLPAVAA